VIGTPEAQETLDEHPQLTITTTGVLCLALNLPYKEYLFIIFMDNLFTTISLFSTLRGYDIGACGTACSKQFLGQFKEETLKKNNGSMLEWSEI
jgi:hypothetical protein